MKLALAYSSKDKVEQTEKTLPRLIGDFDVHWGDGSQADEGRLLFKRHLRERDTFYPDITGGADAAIAWKLSTLLAASEQYTHIGLIENDVMLDPDWYEPTMALFEKGRTDGFEVGAASPRSYVDRVLIQREGYAVMHNIGAGFIIFTREAAELVLRSFRTHWWPDNRRLFAQLSGIDLNTWIGFQEQVVTTDWGWEAQLASHGLASLALTPSKAQMPWEDTSISTMLKLVDAEHAYVCWNQTTDDSNFKRYRDTLQKIRQGIYKPGGPGIIQRFGNGMMFYPHQLGYLAGGLVWQGNLELQNSQAHGPFAYRTGAGGAFLLLRISGSCSFLVGGGTNGAQASIRDTRSGFNFDPALPAMQSFVELSVPGGPVPREITLEMSEGAVFFGVQTTEAQMLDTSFRFDWAQLPEAK